MMPHRCGREAAGLVVPGAVADPAAVRLPTPYGVAVPTSKTAVPPSVIVMVRSLVVASMA